MDGTIIDNGYGVKVKRCCASCRYKKVTRLMTQRRCTRLHENVRPGDVCKHWEMRQDFKKLGIIKNDESFK